MPLIDQITPISDLPSIISTMHLAAKLVPTLHEILLDESDITASFESATNSSYGFVL